MKLHHLYLIIVILGTVIPYLFFLQFLPENGLDLALFAEQMLGTEIATFFTWDVVISTLAVLTLVFTEGLRLQMKNLWLYVAFKLSVDVPLALPAFLYARLKQLDQVIQQIAAHV